MTIPRYVVFVGMPKKICSSIIVIVGTFILLPPEEQEVIRLMLEKVGADSKMDFDKYEGHINWST